MTPFLAPPFLAPLFWLHSFLTPFLALAISGQLSFGKPVRAQAREEAPLPEAELPPLRFVFETHTQREEA